MSYAFQRYEKIAKENGYQVENLVIGLFRDLPHFLDKYFSYIPNMTQNGGSKVLEEYEKIVGKEHNMLKKCGKGESHNQ